MIRRRRFVLICLLVLVVGPGRIFAEPGTAKNVIVLVMDGTGATHTTVSRWYKGSALNLDRMVCGQIRTYNSVSLITDSAPAATAFACGYKTSDKVIGVLPEEATLPGQPKIEAELKNKPVASVLEGAKLAGKATGLVVTSNVQHATPAGFSAHWPDRNNYLEIGKQQVFQNIDVVFGGGKKYLLPASRGGDREDGADLIAVLKSKGYDIAETREEMQKAGVKKIWGLFAVDAMAYELDRRAFYPEQPSLAEMTQKAIEILSKSPKGFFLFVEGSKIDWASHANDPVGVIGDTLAFDDAVGKALKFAEKDKQTLVLAFTDHGNGGMSLGCRENKGYTKTSYESLVGPLKKARLTGEGVEKKLGEDRAEENVRTIVKDFFGIGDLTAEEVAAIRRAERGKMNGVVGPMMSRRAGIGWTTNGHTGEDVFLYAYGPNRPVGLIENTQIAWICAGSMGFDLKEADRRLFVLAGKALAGPGVTVKVEIPAAAGPMLVVTKGSRRAELPLSTNLVKIGKEIHELPGITVFAPRTKRVYVPQAAVDWIKDKGF
jgi:alkaline phosphatase